MRERVNDERIRARACTCNSQYCHRTMYNVAQSLRVSAQTCIVRIKIFFSKSYTLFFNIYQNILVSIFLYLYIFKCDIRAKMTNANVVYNLQKVSQSLIFVRSCIDVVMVFLKLLYKLSVSHSFSVDEEDPFHINLLIYSNYSFDLSIQLIK